MTFDEWLDLRRQNEWTQSKQYVDRALARDAWNAALDAVHGELYDHLNAVENVEQSLERIERMIQRLRATEGA